MFINITHKEELSDLLMEDKNKIEELLTFMDDKDFIITKIRPRAKIDDRDRFIIEGVVRMELKSGGDGLVLSTIFVTTNIYTNKFIYKFGIK